MRVIFTSPKKTAYHDNTTWFPIHRKPPEGGVWLKPGEKVVVLSPEEFKELELEGRLEV